MTQYFSDRELGEQPQVNPEISSGVWNGIAWLIQERIDDGSFRRNPMKNTGRVRNVSMRQ